MYYRTFHFVSPFFFIIFLNLIWSSKSMYTPQTDSLLGPSDHREAYFNGTTSYIRLQTTISLLKHTGLSFRTCIGGELFSQKYLENTISLSVTKNGLEFVAGTSTSRFNTKIVAHLLDNKWHTVNLEYRVGNLTLSIDEEYQLIANKTYNPELLTNTGLSNEGAILLVGKQFSGCILEGPSIVFNKSVTQPHDVLFGPCPIPTNSCAPRADIIQNKQEIIDHCANEPCMRHGQCISRPDRYECICSPRYSGKNCEVDNGPVCQKYPPICLNGASCLELNSSGDYQCICVPGFTGEFCESELRIHQLCQNDPCLNNGTCRVLPGSSSIDCVCAAGYTGQYCETDVNECHSNPCENGGRCVDARNSYKCLCSQTGYKGVNCEINIDECLDNPCLNHAVCFDTYGSYVCQCQDGYGGHDCDQNLNECVSMPCQNKGTCRDTIGGYECLCQSGFSGKNCELSLCDGVVCAAYAECIGYRCACKPGFTGIYPNCTETGVGCLSNPCTNGGICTPYMDTFNCSCPSGFTGKICQHAVVNECSSMPCQNGGECINDADGFHCNCTKDYTGRLCEHPLDICGYNPCNNNGTCITKNKKDFTCNCLPGFTGKQCQHNIDECQHITCTEGRVCKDLIAGYECSCPDGFTGEACQIPIPKNLCANYACANGGTCIVNKIGQVKCICNSGYTGQYCDDDIDECNRPDGVQTCVHGICVNKVGGFQCYCMPGYTGETCGLDFNECLSQPCQHNSTCLNLVNNYQCDCSPGYAGKNCDEEINECESSPCFEGSTCVDQVASFICVCQPGFTGHLCNVNIDDCQSSPCKHGGYCIDGLNNYVCNCSDTGYYGMHCENNIDDCSSNPCKNGASCIDLVKDYDCGCFPGYTGKNCEIDINECDSSPCQNNGTCLQRSNLTIYDLEPKTGLPDIFSQTFSFENASGYECICIDGVTGHDCEIDINECENFPCTKGSTCRNLIGGYSCECEEGTEGKHCEIEIDECARYSPCENGNCIDKKANYFCDCLPNFGGKNCSVQLVGCAENPCLNNGSCKPYVENEIHHKFNCSCQNGFHGDTCEKITTMSFSGSSYIVVNTSREEGYDIELRFKTTLGDGLIAIGKGLTFYFLELVNGRLNLQSSLLNKWEGVFIGSELNNSRWQKVFVAINSSHLVLAANEEQTIYPINLNEGSNTSHTSFPTTYLGENIELTKSRLTHARQAFVGCTEDVIINGEWVLPQNTSHVSLVDIEVGCSRTPQCNPNPCHSSGRCTDKWRTFSCTCERPYLGHTCQYNYTAATFGYENITNSLVVVSVTDAARRAVRSIVDISMFIRTRQSVGQIFYLGSSLSGTNTNEDNHISAKLEGGELLVSILFNSTPESYTVSGVKLDNGFNHLIEVVRNISLVKVILNGTEYFRKTISGTGQLDAQVLYLGGLPEVKRPVRQTDMSGLRIDTTTTSSGTMSAITSPAINFKGIIQDVQISNGTRRMVVEFFPLKDKELGIPPKFGKVSFDSTTLREGVVSDDLCRSNPCEHNGNCTITWNDFKCECPKGYKGKTCSELEFCQLKKKDCPPGSVCNNLEDGYECVSNATFTGRTKPLQYLYAANNYTEMDFEQIFIKYRTKVGGTVMYVKNEEDYFFVFVHRDEVIVQLSLMGRIESHGFTKDNTNGDWNILIFRVKDFMFYGGFKENVEDDNPNMVVNEFNTTAFDDLFSRGTIYLGGSDKRASHFLNLHYTRYNSSNFITNNSVTESNSVDILTSTLPPDFVVSENLNIRDKFKGCLGEIRIGNLLLPFYTTAEMYAANYSFHDYFSLIEKNLDAHTNHTNGCKVCFEEDCRNNGRCAAPEQSYQCNCTAGYAADDCSVNIDECEVSRCQNGASCIDGIANFTCKCVDGYEGWLCDTEINECESNPCRNGGTCQDLLAKYECTCTDDYVGKQCEALRLITCDNNPCKNGSTCTDGANVATGNNFTCTCMKGMEGALCDIPYCVANACKHGVCNTSVLEPFCQCERGYAGHLCEEDIDDCILPTGDSPCLHDGQCTDEVDKYNCNCTGTGYKGLICEHDEDECEDEYICGEKGECKNTPGSFWCDCPSDYCGIRCALPNPCKMSPCGEHGTCNATCKTEATFRCDCEPGYYGNYCNETVVSQSASDDSINIALIIIPIVAILLLGGAAGLAVLIAMARSKRATRGTYSPSAQEFCNPRVELDHVLKPPPEERLI